jgi:hypothetical protein
MLMLDVVSVRLKNAAAREIGAANHVQYRSRRKQLEYLARKIVEL